MPARSFAGQTYTSLWSESEASPSPVRFRRAVNRDGETETGRNWPLPIEQPGPAVRIHFAPAMSLRKLVLTRVEQQSENGRTDTRNLKVYDYQKDKSTPILHQAKELAIAGASHLFKNRSTEKVAADIDLKGKLTSPDISTWQALAQVLRNAFIEAIIPGFDRAVASNAPTDTIKQAQAH
jgi:hypothetical protein